MEHMRTKKQAFNSFPALQFINVVYKSVCVFTKISKRKEIYKLEAKRGDVPLQFTNMRISLQ